MQPLSPRVRFLYLFVFALLFAVLLPLVILYADGWRFSRELGMYKTGGVYVTIPYTGVEVTINGRYLGTTNILQRGFYVNNLAPSTYVLRASRDGFYAWERMVVVEPQLVTDARVLLMPTTIQTTRLVLSGTATGTRAVQRATLDEYAAMFAVAAPASSTVPVDTSETTGLYIVSGDLLMRWLSDEGPVPSVFCYRPSHCVPDMLLEGGSDTTLSAAFFEGGIVYRTKENGIYFTEADVRPTPRSLFLYKKAGADFRIVNGVLIIKDGTSYYEISGL